MNDLNTINLQNAKAIEAAIPALQAKGKWVVAEFRGLQFFGFSTHPSEREANAYACQLGGKAGVTTRVFQPTKKESTL